MASSVRFHMTPRQQATTVVPLGISLLMVVYFQGSVLGGRAAIFAAAASTITLVGTVVCVRWWGIELTPTEVVVRRNTARRVPWSEVQAVRTGRSGTSRYVEIEINKKRKLRSPAPATGVLLSDGDFEAKIAYIEQWWRWARAEGPGDQSAWPLPSDVGWAQRVVGPR